MAEPTALFTDSYGTLEIYKVPDHVQAWLDSLPRGRKSIHDSRDDSLQLNGRLRQFVGWFVTNDPNYTFYGNRTTLRLAHYNMGGKSDKVRKNPQRY